MKMNEIIYRTRFFNIWCCVLLLLGFMEARAQAGRMWQTHYDPTQYKAHPLVWAFAQDSLGLLYMANNDGIVIFDGVRWQLVPTPRPVRALTLDAAGRLYVGCLGDFGRLNAQPNGALYYQSLADKLTKKAQQPDDVSRVHAAAGNVYFVTAERIIRYHEKDDLFDLQVQAEGEIILGSCQLNNQTGNTVYLGTTSGFFELKDETLQPVAGGAALAGKTPAAAMGNGARLRIVTLEDEVYEWAGSQAKRITAGIMPYLKHGQTYDAAPLHHAPLWVAATQKSGAVLVNDQNEIVQYLDKTAGLPDNDIYAVYVDAADGVWLAHGKGISCLRPTLPIQNITSGELSGKITDLAYHNGALYAATSQGVFAQGPGGFRAVSPIAAESWKLLVAQGRLLAATSDGVYEVVGATARKVLAQRLAFNLSLSMQNGNRVWVASAKGAAPLDWNGKQWAPGRGGIDTKVELNSAVQLSDGSLLLGTNYEGVLTAKPGDANLQSVQASFGKTAAEVRVVGSGVLVHAARHYYTYSGSTRQLSAENVFARALPPEAKLLQADNEFVLAATITGLHLYRKQGEGFALQPLPLGMLPGAKPQTAVMSGNKIWIADYDQLYAIDHSAKPVVGTTRLVVRSIQAGSDSVMYGGWQANAAGRYQSLQPQEIVSIPYDLRRFSIDFAATDLINPAAVRYQYYLEGSEPGYGAWGNTATATYNNLWPGNYTFRIKARHALGAESVPVALNIRIVAPWYLTIGAYAAYGILALTIVFLVARFYARREHLERLRLEVIVHERTKEVTAQKAQIETQVQELASQNTVLNQTMSELKEAQSQLIQAEKMASLGQLVAGVAHEVNTPLGISVTAASTLQMRTENLAELMNNNQMKKSDLTQFIGDAKETSMLILRNLQRAADLIQSFKRVAVDQSSEQLRTFKLDEYMHEVITSMSPQFKKYPKVQISQQGDAGIVMNSSPSALSQIVMNLVNNALIHAFGPEREGHIRVSFQSLDKNLVQIRVADNGKGIAQQNLAKVFDPFFTTNRAGGGSGLGLHIVYNLVTSSLKGKIDVTSEEGKGTTFTMEIPAHIG